MRKKEEEEGYIRAIIIEIELPKWLIKHLENNWMTAHDCSNMVNKLIIINVKRRLFIKINKGVHPSASTYRPIAGQQVSGFSPIRCTFLAT